MKSTNWRGLALAAFAAATLLLPPLLVADQRVPVALTSPDLGTIATTFETKGLFGSRSARVSWTDPRGVVRLSGTLRDGKADGLWVTRRADGRVASETRYSAGRLDGPSTSFYPSGRLARRASFRNGRPDGLRQAFEENGKLRDEREFKKGKMTRWRSRRVVGALDEPRFAWDGRVFLSHQHRKYCRVSGRSIRCREPGQVWEAAESIRGSEFAADVLDELESLHEGALGAGGAGDILFACGTSDVYRATPIVAGPPAKAAGFRSAAFTIPERDAMFGACDAGGREPRAGLPGGGAGLTQGQTAAVENFDRAIGACSSSSTTGPVQSGGGKGTPRGVSALEGGGDVLPRNRQPGTPGWFRDAVEHAGFGAAQPLPGGGYGSRAIDDPDVYQITRSLGRTFLRVGADTIEQVEIDDTDGWTISHTWDRSTGRLLTETFSIPTDSGTDVTIYDYTKRTTTRISYDKKGNEVSREVTPMDPSNSADNKPAPVPPPVPLPPPPPPPPPAPIDPADAPSPSPDPVTPPPPPLDPPPAPLDPAGPDAGQPDPDDPRSRCERAADSWARFRTDCDRSGWQTFTCQEFLRLLSGCVSTALIQPTPDGGTACADRAASGDPRQANCERRKRFEGAGGAPGLGRFLDRVSSCAAPVVDGPGPSDICLDPHAQCRPDLLFGPGELTDDRGRGVQPPAPNGGR